VTLTSATVPPPVGCRPEDAPALGPRDVQLWHAELDRGPADDALLDAAERERAALMIPRVRRRFAASRCLLRRILGAVTGRDPAALHFETVGEGKPRVAPFRSDSPRFNLSHADDRWLLAVSTLEVGVDVERTDRPVDLPRVAKRLFTPAEAAAILRESGDVRRRAFFRTWTAREALAKARSEGMFTLALEAEIRAEPGAVLRLSGAGAGTWFLLEVPVEPPWCAAVAAAAPPDTVASFRADVP
jgi:4'-phosphopantetheinyl transferase